MSKTVFVGLSGGVDSSTSAALLQQQGYEVVGVYMKNWTEDVIGFECPWRQDLADAQSVAAQLNIPLKVYDFQAEYKQKVVDYMVEEYRSGNTPNPDIMCNQEVKFKLFLETALDDGADLIATGHYARIKPLPSRFQGQTLERGNERYGLFTGVDHEKDQSYFLARVSEAALKKTLMPLGDLEKTEVRKRAEAFGLPVADKPDSQGICFIGEVDIKDFLREHIPPQNGPIKTHDGQVVGEHDGAAYYTIGQRHGLNITTGGGPYYVTSKDMQANTVYVTDNPYDPKLHYEEFNITDLHWINGEPDLNYDDVPSLPAGRQVRTRYRGPLHPAHLKRVRPFSDGVITIKLDGSERAITPGQSAVIYDEDQVLGSGIIV